MVLLPDQSRFPRLITSFILSATVVIVLLVTNPNALPRALLMIVPLARLKDSYLLFSRFMKKI